ncbi:MAG: type II secretion system F family protein, partial [Ignavibacteriales bacterium]|nr:type II secretion system F family protein [Ignavibacteriales bacterium]
MAAENVVFHIVAKDISGKPLQGFISARSLSEAKKKIRTHPRFRDSKILTIRRKITFSYRVRQGTKIIDGHQTAYSRQEVKDALVRLGFEVRSVQRYHEFRFRAASNEIVSFIATSARLLEQKMPYNEVLQIMATNVRDRNMKAALRDIILDLKNGGDSREAFTKQSKVFGEHTALMLGIASKSGDMTAIFKSVAVLVERQAEFKKGLTSSLVLPAVTGLTLVGALGFYVLFLLPKMMALMGPLIEETPALTQATLNASAFIQDHVWIICGSLLAMIVGFYAYIFSADGRLWLHRTMIRLPYVGNILRNTSSEIFCRVLGILYGSAGENIEAIQLAGEASGNRYLAHQIKTTTVPTMLKFGTELAKAMEMAGFFPDLFISRFKTAAETGAVKDT